MKLFIHIPPPHNINIKNELTIYNRIFLPGNKNTIKICYNPNAIYKYRLLIFGDSFINETIMFLKPFLEIFYMFVVQHFKQI